MQQHQRLGEALVQFDEASRLVPRDIQFLTAREVVKAKLVFDHIERGNALLVEDAREKAAAEFHAAVELDPENHFAQDRLQEAMQTLNSPPPSPPLERVTESEELHLVPTDDRATFHFTGDVRSLFTELAAAYKMTVQFDDSVQPRQVRFNVDNLDFFTALRLACGVSKTMWAALDTSISDRRRQCGEPQAVRPDVVADLPCPPHSTPQETTDLINVLRNTLELRYMNSGQTADILEVRGPAAFGRSQRRPDRRTQ